MAAAREPRGKVGEEGLGACRVRFANRGHQGRNKGNPQAATVFQARSRGGLAPTVS